MALYFAIIKSPLYISKWQRNIRLYIGKGNRTGSPSFNLVPLLIPSEMRFFI